MSVPLPPAAAAVPETMRAVLADCPPGATAPVYTYSDSARVRAPGAGELLVRVQLVSVCNSDAKMHAGAAFFWARPHGRCWANGRTGAVVPGHEWVAVVVAAGEGMGSWAVGDQVLCEQFMACVVGAGEKACWACREGHANKCERLRVFGQGLDGAMADFMVLPRGALLHKVDPPLPPAVAVLAELSFTPRMEVAMEVLRGGRRGGRRVDLQRNRVRARSSPTSALASPALDAAAPTSRYACPLLCVARRVACRVALRRGQRLAAFAALLEQHGAEHCRLGEARHAQQACLGVGRARRLARHARRAVQHEGGLDGEGAELGVVAVEPEGGARGGEHEGPAARAARRRVWAAGQPRSGTEEEQLRPFKSSCPSADGGRNGLCGPRAALPANRRGRGGDEARLLRGA